MALAFQIRGVRPSNRWTRRGQRPDHRVGGAAGGEGHHVGDGLGGGPGGVGRGPAGQQGQGGGKEQAGDSSPKAGEGGKPDPKAPPKNIGQAAGEIDPSVPAKYAKVSMDVNKHKGVAEEVEAFEAKVEQVVQQAILTAKMMGKAPAGVEMAMEKIRVVDRKSVV